MTAAMSTLRRVSYALILVLLPALAAAQSPAQPAPERTDPDVRIDPLQPDFNLAALPTTLRMPAHKLAFRVTHRFSRPLGEGDLSDLVSDLFGFDSGAQIGLELRYGLLPGTQIGIHRTSERTIEIFGQHNFMNERDGAPIGLDALGTLEGTDNLRGRRLGALGAVASRNLGRYAVLYAEPLWVINSNPLQTGDDHTVMLGLGGRLRVRPSIYLVAEVTPRLVGYGPGANQMSFGIESRNGGHLFQLNVSNGSGTTPGQLAGGGISYDDWYIGFNIARKFF
jgi:uncharacterized beta barrel domain-containing protein DUF5777